MWPDLDDVEDLEGQVLDGLELLDDQAPAGTVPLEAARRRRAANLVDELLGAD